MRIANLSERGKILDFDAILVSACRALHRDEVVQRGDHDLPPGHIHAVGGPFQKLVIETAAGVAEAVKVTMVCLEGEVQPVPQRCGVQLKRNVNVNPA